MKIFFKSAVLGCLFPVLTLPILADPQPQSQISFTSGSSGTWNADWTGADHRIYALQWSLDLVTWKYFPFADFGIGSHNWGFASSSDKFFIRLEYYDDPEINTLEQAISADPDGDGLPTGWELANQFMPFSPETESTFLQYLASLPAAPASFEIYTPLQ